MFRHFTATFLTSLLYMLYFMSLMRTGYAIKCYSCSAKFGRYELVTYKHGPCWDENFDGSQLDIIHCRRWCVLFIDFNREPKSRAVTVFRGCAPNEGCEKIPHRTKFAEDKPEYDEKLYPTCCNTSYCNRSDAASVATPWPLWVAASCSLVVHVASFQHGGLFRTDIG